MSDRVFAIIHDEAALVENAAKLVSAFKAVSSRVVVYTPFNGFSAEGAEVVIYDPALLDIEPKVRNRINVDLASCGFVHVVKSSVELTGVGLETFLTDLEKMMDTLDYSVWFNTALDGCNFVYSKYMPRMSVKMDDPEVNMKAGLPDLDVTSHSNTQWVVYDMPRLKGSDLLRFDEKFSIPMFFIIEFLARRRNTKASGSLYFMNQYLTVATEKGVFKEVKRAREPEDSAKMKAEDAVFRSMNLDFTADQSLDTVLETLWEKIAAKAGLAAVEDAKPASVPVVEI